MAAARAGGKPAPLTPDPTRGGMEGTPKEESRLEIQKPRRLLRVGATILLTALLLPVAYWLVGEARESLARRRFEHEVGPLDPYAWVEPSASSRPGPIGHVRSELFRPALPVDELRACVADPSRAGAALRERLAAGTQNALTLRRVLDGALRSSEPILAPREYTVIDNLLLEFTCDGLLAFERNDLERVDDRIELLGRLTNALLGHYNPAEGLRAEWAETHQAVLVHRWISLPGLSPKDLRRIAGWIPRHDPIAERYRNALPYFVRDFQQAGFDRLRAVPADASDVERLTSFLEDLPRLAGAPYVQAAYLDEARHLLVDFPKSTPAAAAAPGWNVRLSTSLDENQKHTADWTWLVGVHLDGCARDLRRAAQVASCRRLALAALYFRLQAEDMGVYSRDWPSELADARSDLLNGAPFVWTVHEDGSASLGLAPEANADFPAEERLPLRTSWHLPAPRMGRTDPGRP